MTLNEWLVLHDTSIDNYKYAPGLWGFVNFLREVVSIYDFNESDLTVLKDFEMTEPDVDGGLMLMPIVRLRSDDGELDVVIKYDFSTLSDIYVILDLNNRELGLPDIFKGQKRMFWDFIEAKEDEYKEMHVEEFVGKARFYMLPDNKELFAYFSAILNYDAFTS